MRSSLQMCEEVLAPLQRPGDLVAAVNMPTRPSAYMLGSTKYPEVIRAFDQYLIEHQSYVNALAEQYWVNWKVPEQK